MSERPRLLIVAGPTCSGKSALAMEIARTLGGIVINADAMQCYRDLRILTARPSPADEAAVPHALYGVRSAADSVTAAWWRTAALDIIAETKALPILCGGSGLYLNALLHGLASIPDPGPEARAEARALLAEYGPAALHARLAAADPETAAGLRPSDGQRLARAWEVWRGTGRGLAAWQSAQPPAKPAFDTRAIVLDPPRATLRAAIAQRWHAMLGAGALAEVAALRAQDLDPALPILRAHGVPELCAHLDGDLTLAEASARAIAATGRYTKRQATWLRHHSLAEPDHLFTIHAGIDAESQLSSKFNSGMTHLLSWRD